MASIRIPTPLRSYADGQSEVAVRAGTVNAALDDLLQRYPALAPHLLSAEGELRPFVNLFLGDQNVRDLDGLQTPLQDGDRLMLLPSIAGG